MGLTLKKNKCRLPISDDEAADGADLVAGPVVLDQVCLRVGGTPDLLHLSTENARRQNSATESGIKMTIVAAPVTRGVVVASGRDRSRVTSLGACCEAVRWGERDLEGLNILEPWSPENKSQGGVAPV